MSCGPCLRSRARATRGGQGATRRACMRRAGASAVLDLTVRALASAPLGFGWYVRRYHAHVLPICRDVLAHASGVMIQERTRMERQEVGGGRRLRKLLLVGSRVFYVPDGRGLGSHVSIYSGLGYVWRFIEYSSSTVYRLLQPQYGGAHTLLTPLRDVHCFNQVLAAALSCGLLVGGCIVRLPQLLKIYRARSVAGLSEFSIYVEMLAAWLHVGYNVLERHPLMTWGEMIPVALMNLLIALLFWKFRPTGETKRTRTRSMRAADAGKERTFSAAERKATASFLVLLAVLVLCVRCFLRKSNHFYQIFSSVLGLSPVPLLLLSRIPQIKQNAEQKHTGQLSAGSLALMVLGNLARLFTTFTNLSDRFILLSCSLACVLNVIPLIQATAAIVSSILEDYCPYYQDVTFRSRPPVIVWYRQRTEQFLKHLRGPVSSSRGGAKTT